MQVYTRQGTCVYCFLLPLHALPREKTHVKLLTCIFLYPVKWETATHLFSLCRPTYIKTWNHCSFPWYWDVPILYLNHTLQGGKRKTRHLLRIPDSTLTFRDGLWRKGGMKVRRQLWIPILWYLGQGNERSPFAFQEFFSVASFANGKLTFPQKNFLELLGTKNVKQQVYPFNILSRYSACLTT